MSGSGQQGIYTSQLPAGSYRPGTGARSILAAKGNALRNDINYGLGPPQRDPNALGRSPYPAGSTNPNDRLMQGGYGNGFPDAQRDPNALPNTGIAKDAAVSNTQWGGGNPWFNNPTPMPLPQPTSPGNYGGSGGGKGGSGTSGYGSSNGPTARHPTPSGSGGKGGSGAPAGGAPTDPIAMPKPFQGGPTNQQQTSAEWAQAYAQAHPEAQGSYIDLLDQFKPGADGSMAGMPILNGWDQLKGQNGFTGFKDGLFYQNGRDVIGQINGNDPFNADNRQRLGSQGFRVAIPKLGQGMVNGVDPRTWGFGG